ncbi:MAG: hypothetical protein J3Q66DRAFT_322026 [Benniella sp.]|nr:MAG: hypothetical protein J3Q66DRAFT_322026 [Benniella sp.]
MARVRKQRERLDKQRSQATCEDAYCATGSSNHRNSFGYSRHSWTVAGLDAQFSHGLSHDSDTDLDDEYSLLIPGLSKMDVQIFLWEYAYIPDNYQDDIATLIRYLRRDEWRIHGSKGSIVVFDWNLEGVQKYSREYNQNKIRKVELREQDEAKKAQEAAQRQQEEWNRQQEIAREQEMVKRMKVTDDFIWKMHKSHVVSQVNLVKLEKLMKSLEAEISESFGFCFVTLSAVGSYAAGTFTHQSELDLTLTGNIKDIEATTLADSLGNLGYEGSTVSIGGTRHASSLLESVPQSIVTFTDSRTGMTCHLTLNEPITIRRSKLIQTYALIDSRFGAVMVALNHLAFQRHLLTGSIHHDRKSPAPVGSYALALMLITFFQTESPPILPRLQQTESHDEGGDSRVIKETFVQGIDCSFDQDWRFYQGFGIKNTKSAAELLIEFCRFFGYVFDYESKEVNARLGAFRWRSDQTKPTNKAVAAKTTPPSSSKVSTPSPSSLSAVTETDSTSSYTPSPSLSSQSRARNDADTFHVMDPFTVGLNLTSTCREDLVRTVKECFQETYEALMEGNINMAFSGL